MIELYRSQGHTLVPEVIDRAMVEALSEVIEIQRCHHCGKPGAERWDWHGLHRPLGRSAGASPVRAYPENEIAAADQLEQ